MKTLPSNLVDSAINEASRLIDAEMLGSDFLTSVLPMLLECKRQNYSVPDQALGKFSRLGQASIRALDSFDHIPEAIHFLDLACQISDELS